MTPADELRAAADLIEQFAAKATPGPWTWATFRDVDELVHPMEIAGSPVHPLNVLKVSHDDWPANTADKAWITCLSPAVAPALAEWLRAEAGAMGVHEVEPEVHDAAVEFARAVLTPAAPEETPSAKPAVVDLAEETP